MFGPKQDPYRAAAFAALDGDYEKAFEAIKPKWIEDVMERAVDRLEPDADEDGYYYPNPRKALIKTSEEMLDGWLDQSIGDAAYEILSVDDEAQALSTSEDIASKVRIEFSLHAEDVGDEAYEIWSDGRSYARDPHGYYGVSRKDFF